MSRVSDHVRRDAEHAARAEFSILLGRFQRRLYEAAKTGIDTAIAEAPPGAELDGTAIGRAAASAAATKFLADSESPEPAAIEAAEE